MSFKRYLPNTSLHAFYFRSNFPLFNILNFWFNQSVLREIHAEQIIVLLIWFLFSKNMLICFHLIIFLFHICVKYHCINTHIYICLCVLYIAICMKWIINHIFLFIYRKLQDKLTIVCKYCLKIFYTERFAILKNLINESPNRLWFFY